MTVEPRPVAVDPGRSTAGASASASRTPGIAVDSRANPAGRVCTAEELADGAKSRHRPGPGGRSEQDEACNDVMRGSSSPRETPDRQIADMAGDTALPRKNGELVFESACAARTFGMTIALNAARAFPWNDFRDRLIAEIADAERHGRDTSYFERWFAAFERLLDAEGLVSREELDARTAELESGRRDDVF